MPKHFYPSEQQSFNLFYYHRLVVRDGRASFLRPHTRYTVQEKADLMARYIQEVLNLPSIPELTDSTLTRTHEFYQFDRKFYLLIHLTRSVNLKGD